MVRMSKMVLKNIGEGIGKTLSEILVCPLTKQPLRYCEKTGSLISDEIGVSFPAKKVHILPDIEHVNNPYILDAYIDWNMIVDGIPCLVPKDGKILEDQGSSTTGGLASSAVTKDVQD